MYRGPDLRNVELNEEFRRALELMENTNRNVFVTGRAGTGKSTLIRYFMSQTRKSVVLLAPTGVAAVNIGGETIHSFFDFPVNVTVEDIVNWFNDPKSSSQSSRARRRTQKGDDTAQSRSYEKYSRLNTIIIDEVSMLRADLLDCIDVFLQHTGPVKGARFGGVQVIFVGDLYQLPPVVLRTEKEIFEKVYDSPYFFSSDAFRNSEFEFVELFKIYRQVDPVFIELLNRIRSNYISEDDLALLNSRVQPERADDPYAIYITTTNEKVTEINNEKLSRLPGRLYAFDAVIFGLVPKELYPTDEVLFLKKNAQVMMLTNDSQGRWVNGTIGYVRGVKESTLEIELETGEYVEVWPFTWDIFTYEYDKRLGRIVSKTLGQFTQFPVRLAWAITIHKSQGLTFRRVVIDVSRGTFSPGQLYVAISRATSLEGITLVRPIKRNHIFVDKRIVAFINEMRAKAHDKRATVPEKSRIIEEAARLKKKVMITYVDSKGERTTRLVTPLEIGEFSFQSRSFFGFRAFCHVRNEERVFRFDRVESITVEGVGERDGS